MVDERYAYALPSGFGDEGAAPLLCAGTIGYRALRRAEVPPSGRLGIYGFGGSAHLAAQIAIPPLRYADHLFQERQLLTVTANTRRDGEELLAIASRIGIRVETVTYPLEHADAALRDLAHDRFSGAAVLRVSG